MKKNFASGKFRLFKIIVVILFAMSTLVGVTYAAVVAFKTFTHGNMQGDIVKMDVTSSFQLASKNKNITFNKSGDSENIQIEINNKTKEPLHYYYQISATDNNVSNNKDDLDIKNAILVHYNNHYLGTLNEVTKINDDKMFLDEALFSSEETLQTPYTLNDSITFTLHNAFDSSTLDNSSINVSINIFTETYDYSKYSIIHNENDFLEVLREINAHELESQILVHNDEIELDTNTLVLMNDITLSRNYEINDRVKIVSRDHTIITNDFNISLNDEKAIVYFDLPSYDFDLDLVSYDRTNATKMISKSLKNALKDNVINNVNLSSSLKGYGNLFAYTEDTCTLNNYTLTAKATNSSKVDFVTFNNEKILFKVQGTNTNEIEDSYFINIPSNLKVVSNDIYLPSSIKEKNAYITWTSNKPYIISNDGRIVASYANEEDVTLHAEIRVNNFIYTRDFTFKVSLHISEVNFFKLMGEMSPIVLYTIYSGNNEEYAYYSLPVVDKNSKYDYRKSFTSPEYFNEGEGYVWTGYQELHLTSIQYEEVVDSDGNPVYDFIGVHGNDVYLKRDSLNTYAQVKVLVEQADGTIYEGHVNVIIAAGSNTEVLEPGFSAASEEVDKVNILYNIISSRIENGYKNATPDFSLPASVTAEDTLYAVEYTIPAVSSSIIPSVTKDAATNKYVFELDPLEFTTQEERIPISLSITYNGVITKTRTVYITIPAVYKIEDIGNPSLFNTVQYQTFNNLSDLEKTHDTGFTKSNNKLTNSNDKYILVRDLVGDDDYIGNYINSRGISKNYYQLLNEKYPSYSKVTQLDSMKFIVSEKNSVSSTSDDIVYDFTRLIAWATSNTNEKVTNVVNHKDYVSSYLEVESDTKDYLGEEEIEVLKAYYINATRSAESHWNEIINISTEEAPGYLIADKELLNNLVISQIKQYFDEGSRNVPYFKYVEVIQWASNEKNFGGTGGADLWIPNFTQIGAYDWTITPNSSGTNSNDSFLDKLNRRWTRKSVSRYQNSKYYTTKGQNGKQHYYDEDETEYISQIELEIINVFLLNYFNKNLATNGPTIVNTIIDALVLPRYLTSDGVASFINNLYKDLNIDERESFISILKEDVPTVPNMDGFNNILTAIPSLKTLTIKGDNDLSLYLDSTALKTFYNKVANTNKNIEKLVMSNCANNYVKFDVSATKYLTKLTYLDLGYNRGITNPSALVSTSRGNYTYVDLRRIGTTYRFLEYAVENLSSSTCLVKYTDDSTGTEVDKELQRNFTNSDTLTYLSDFDRLISSNMFLANELYNIEQVGSKDNVYWIIEDGNDYKEVSHAKRLEEITSVSQMNAYISPYYYCTNSFKYQNTSFEKGYIYAINPTGTSIKVSKLIPIDSKISSDDDEFLKSIGLTYDEFKISDNKTGTGENVHTVSEKRTGESIKETLVYNTKIDGYNLSFYCFIISQKDGENRRMYFDINEKKLKWRTPGTSEQLDEYICVINDDELNNLLYNDYSKYSSATGSLIGRYSTAEVTTDIKYYFYNPYSGLFADIQNSTSSEINLTYGRPGNAFYKIYKDKYNGFAIASSWPETTWYGSTRETIALQYNSDGNIIMGRLVSNASNSDLTSFNQAWNMISSGSGIYSKSVSLLTNDDIGLFNCHIITSNYDKKQIFKLTETGAYSTQFITKESYFVFLSETEFNELRTNPNIYKTKKMGADNLVSGATYYLYNPLNKLFVKSITNNAEHIKGTTNFSEAAKIVYKLNGTVALLNFNGTTFNFNVNGGNSDYGGIFIGYSGDSDAGSQYTISSTVSYTGSLNLFKGDNPLVIKKNIKKVEIQIYATYERTDYVNHESTDSYHKEITKTHYVNGKVIKIIYIYDIPTSERTNNYTLSDESYKFVVKYTNENNVVQTIDKFITDYDYLEYSYLNDSYEIVKSTYNFKEMIESAGLKEIDVTRNGDWNVTDYNTWKNNLETSSYNITFDKQIQLDYVKEAADTTLIDERYDFINNYVKSEYHQYHLFLYVGETGSETIHNMKVSATSGTTITTKTLSYTKNDAYYLDASNGEVVWVSVGQSSQTAGEETLESILDNLNAQVNNKNYQNISNYYGKYYIYKGTTQLTKFGLFLQNHVYKLILNDTKDGFVYVDYNNKEVVSNNLGYFITNIINGTINQDNLGDIVYVNNADVTNTYSTGYYIVTYNDYTGSYYLKTFTDISLNTNSSYTVLHNNRIYSSGQQYGGTGGQIATVISAFVVNEDGKFEIRRYSVLAIG